MKKILIATNILLLGIALFLACNTNDNNEEPQSGCSQFCKDYSTVPLQGLVNGNLLRSMSEDYKNDPAKSKINYNPVTGESLGADALSLTFDLEKIKNFIWHMENAICVAGCIPQPELGIRFYYIKYPQGIDTTDVHDDLTGLSPTYANKHTLAMVPAYKIGNEWYDFDFNGVAQGCQFGKIVPSGKWASALINLGEGDNHGGIGPPPFPGTYPTNPPE